MNQNGQSFTLENAAISATWRSEDGKLRPVSIKNGLIGKMIDQSGTELFRLATKAAEVPVQEVAGVMLGFRLNEDAVVVMASRDGSSWTELESYPRAQFPGEPKLVRIGKMSLKAEAKDHVDLGAEGEGSISALTPLPASIPDGSFHFKAKANQAAVKEYPFPAGSKWITCRIDKGSDQGLSWSPAMALIWDDGKNFLLAGLREKSPVFNLTTADGEKQRGAKLADAMSFDTTASSFRLAAPPRMLTLAASNDGGRVADRIPGVALEAAMVSESGLRALWRAELRDGSNYLRQTLTLSTSPGSKPQPLLGLELMEARLDDAAVAGRVPGCPVTGEGMFLGVEIPGAMASLGGDRVRIGFPCHLELSAANPYSFGSVTGVAPAGQMRRAFLCYIERERARPSKPFLHYNCWYDLGYGVDEPKMLEVVKAFDTELVKKRGVPVDSYLVDDGWDSPDKGLWVDNLTKFPKGLSGLNKRMKPYGAHLSVWISPLGGYGGAKERTEWARKEGLIPATSELDLSQPGYKKWFQDRCLELMREAGVNAFKWDRAGEGVSPHFMALLDIGHNLHKENPELFLNVTVGTWPSPFWLNHVDSTWRNGSADVGWAGKGDDREKWLTFRDGSCHSLFVEASPLYPLNSVMHHGIVHGREFQGEKVGKSGVNLKNEARSYFANGATLQELYLTPSMMTAEAWDDVAEAAKWAHANADVLVDSHWVGGDPMKLEPYGYAAWSPRKGTLMIRNPDDKARTIELDAAKVFELPTGAPANYVLRSPFPDQRVKSAELRSGEPLTVKLEAFEVLVFDAMAK